MGTRFAVEPSPRRTGDEVVVEQFLEGEELSVLALTDGYTIVPLPAAQDHKRVADNDQVRLDTFGARGLNLVRRRCRGDGSTHMARKVRTPAGRRSPAQGPNTGGMGAYAPAPLATPALLEKIVRTILKPTVDGLRRDGTPRSRNRSGGARLTQLRWACGGRAWLAPWMSQARRTSACCTLGS